ncbi:MAG: hypothetical protein N2Z85_02610 [Patescibacteria group bacterium]|nr:hypothetical protein [Patescibacteria group bacterium]
MENYFKDLILKYGFCFNVFENDFEFTIGLKKGEGIKIKIYKLRKEDIEKAIDWAEANFKKANKYLKVLSEKELNEALKKQKKNKEFMACYKFIKKTYEKKG